MFPVHVCRHWQIEWLGSRDGLCKDCGKLGHWFDGMVLWQRRGTGRVSEGRADRGSDATQELLVGITEGGPAP